MKSLIYRIASISSRVILIAALPLLIACGSGGGDADVRGLTPATNDCSISGQNRFVFDYLRDFYFWAGEVDETANLDSYGSPAELLEDLKFKPIDRFSSITDAAAFNSFQEGQFVGLGLYIVRDEQDDPVIAFSHSDSPAAQSGLKRGDRITEINGVRGAALRDRQQYNAAFGPSGAGNEVILNVVPRGESEEVSHSVTAALVTINPTPVSETFQRSGKTIGYLQFTNFLGNAVDDLDGRFAEFAAAGTNELVLDLRYNGGGRLSTATHLASLLGGNRSNGADFARLLYNNQHPELNFTFRFNQPRNSLSLQRVYVLSTSATCSASEALINGLRGAGSNNSPSTPIEVIVIGNTTCGKPVGSNPQSFCDKVMPATTFELRNAQNQGGYHSGFNSSCEVDDDLSRALGNSNEAQLAAALHYIDQESCPVAAVDGNENFTANAVDSLPLARSVGINR